MTNPAHETRRGFLARVFSGSAYRHELADERAFLTRRVRLFLGVLFWFFAAFTLGSAGKWWAFRGDAALAGATGIATVVMAGVSLFIGAGWWRHREPCDCSSASMGLFESAGAIVTSLVVGCVALVLPVGLPVWNLPFLVVLVLVVRAALVPSTALRTAVVGLLCSAALTTPIWIYCAGAEQWTDRLVWVAVGTWGIVFTFATAIVSRVIYGLHVSVRRAMQLGNYTLEHKIGEGGMGVVYLASHALLRRPTAVKLLRRDRIAERSIARFEREVQQTSRLEHPNIVVIYDYGHTPEGQFYYAMEYLDGLSLAELVVQEGPLPPGRVIHIMQQVAHALADAHKHGLIHRDVKPANILLCDRGGLADFAKVLDFGLVKLIDAPRDQSLTAVDSIAGTPGYLAPEALIDPATVDARTDLYALGAIGYFLLTGTEVYSGNTVVETCAHHLHTAPEDPAERLGKPLPPDLVAVVMRCLAKSAADRYPDALALREALLACRDSGSWGLAQATTWWRDSRDQISQHQGTKRSKIGTGKDTLAVVRTTPTDLAPRR